MEQFNGIDFKPALLRSLLGHGYVSLITWLYLWQGLKRKY